MPTRSKTNDASGWPRRRRGMLLAGGLTALALAVSGCGGNSPQPAGASTPEASAETAKKQLPGIKEFGLTEEEYAQHIEKTQALIAQCMNEAGFEYIPVDVKTIELAQSRVRMDPGFTRRSYKEKWGLAVTRVDHPVRDTGLGPNLQIWQNLPPADQAAYSRTLWGEHPEKDFVFAFDEEDFSETGGCTREAVKQVFTPEQLKGTYVNPKDVLVDSDPRIVKALREWSKCMRGYGYNYVEDQDEIIDEFEERLDKLTGGEDPATLTGSRAAALQKLQQEEIKVSLADLDCQIKHTDEVYRQVEIEVYGQPVSG